MQGLQAVQAMQTTPTVQSEPMPTRAAIPDDDFYVRFGDQMLLEYDGGYVLPYINNQETTSKLCVCSQETADELKEGKNITHIFVSNIDAGSANALKKILDRFPTATLIAPATMNGLLKPYIEEYIERGTKISLVEEDRYIIAGDLTLNVAALPFTPHLFNLIIAVKEKGIVFTGAFLALDRKPDNNSCSAYLKTLRRHQYNCNIVCAVDFLLCCHKSHCIKYIIPSNGKEMRMDSILPALERFSQAHKLTEIELSKKEPYNTPQQKQSDRERAIIVYCSTSMNTKILANNIQTELTKALPTICVELTNDNIDDIAGSFRKYRVVCIGTSTIDREPAPLIAALLAKLHYYDFFNTLGLAFGTYSWSSEGVDIVHCKMESLGIRCAPALHEQTGTQADVVSRIEQLISLEDESVVPYDEVGNFLNGHFYDGVMRLYKCNMCLQDYERVNLPHKCINCGARQEKISLVGDAFGSMKATEWQNIVIVGGGCAAYMSAFTVKKTLKSASITIISDEKYLPYNRVKVTGVAFGNPPERLQLKDKEFYDRMNISVLLETTVTGVDTERMVVHAVGQEGEEDIEYTQLIICTGAEPLKIFRKHKNLFYIRKIEDVRDMGKYIVKGSRGAIIGGGVLGLEILEEIPTKDVDIIEKFTCLGRQAPWTIAKEFVREIEKTGVNVFNGAEVLELVTEDDSDSCAVEDRMVTHLRIRYEDEVTDLRTDWVIVAVGVRASTLGFGDRRIKVNGFCQTGVPNVYACGDCCEVEGGHYVDTWSSATQMAFVAGFNAACGSPVKILPLGKPSYTGLSAKAGNYKVVSVGNFMDNDGIVLKAYGCKLYIESDPDGEGVTFASAFGTSDNISVVRHILISAVRQFTPTSLLLKELTSKLAIANNGDVAEDTV